MKDHQLLIGLGLIALAIYFGLLGATLTEFDACMKHAYKDSVIKDTIYSCRLVGKGI